MTTQIDLSKDFHELSTAEVEIVLDEADRCKYRKPNNANGSRARYFFAKLQREQRPYTRRDKCSNT
jgi:hypothetical protein